MGRRGQGSGLRPDSSLERRLDLGLLGLETRWTERGRKGEPPGRAPGRERHARAGGGSGTEPCPSAWGRQAGATSTLRPPGKEPAQAVEAGPRDSVRPQHLWHQKTKSHPRDTRLVCVRRDARGLPPRSHDGAACQQAGVRSPLHRKSEWLWEAGCHHPTGPRDREGRAEITLLCQGRCVPPMPHPQSLSVTHTFNHPNRSLASQARASEDPKDGFWASDPHPTVPSQLQLTRLPPCHQVPGSRSCRFCGRLVVQGKHPGPRELGPRGSVCLSQHTHTHTFIHTHTNTHSLTHTHTHTR